MKRTAFKPKACTDGLGSARATVKVRKPKICAVKLGGCGLTFTPVKDMQKACGHLCAIKMGQIANAKKAERAAKAEAAADRERLAELKPMAHWLGLTERVVNRYIKIRDRGLPCISCGTRRTVQWEAGHYLSVGSRPELRFEPKNINLQCHRCNEHLSGNQAKYRIGLVEKIGEAEVQALEGPHPTAKFTRERLAEIRRKFAAMTRALEREQELEPA